LDELVARASKDGSRDRRVKRDRSRHGPQSRGGRRVSCIHVFRFIGTAFLGASVYSMTKAVLVRFAALESIWLGVPDPPFSLANKSV
jgi:hypothetical protein